MSTSPEGVERPPFATRRADQVDTPAAVHDTSTVVDNLTAFMGCQTSRSKRLLQHRRNVVRTFLIDVPDFLAATDDDVEAWLNGKPLSRKTRNTYRGHVRAFYRFAYETGLTDVEVMRPTQGPGTAKSVTPEGRGQVFMIVPQKWQLAIDDWTMWMRAASRPATTLYIRGYQIRRFAAETVTVDPWTVTSGDLVNWIGDHDWSPESRRSYRSVLRSFYSWGHADGRISFNPAVMLPSVPLPVRSPRPAPEEVWHGALERCDDRLRLMVLLGVRLGLRRGEICKVHSEDVVTSPLGWSLRVTGKGRRQRVLPLAGELRELLAACPRGYVFPGQIIEGSDHRGGHLSPGYVGKLVSKELGPGWTTHTLRHRFATVAYAGKRDLFAVQTLLGHARPETTMGYVQLPDESLRAAVASASEEAS